MDRLSDFIARYANDWVLLTWHAAWQGATVGILALAVVALRRRWTAPVRYGILIVALIKFVMPPLATLPTGLFTLVQISDSRVPPTRPGVAAGPVVSRTSPETVTAKSQAFPERAQEPDRRMLPEDPPVDQANRAARQTNGAHSQFGTAASHDRRAWRLPVILTLVHVSGAVLVLAVFALRVIRLQGTWRWMRRPGREIVEMAGQISHQLGMWRVPEVRLSPETQVPYSAGILHRVVILPASHARDFSPGDLQAILCHELAHHRRGDLLVNFVQVVIGALWWFHPVVWLLNRAIRRVREECCDDLLLSQKLVHDESYCTTLLRVAQTCRRRRFAAPVSVSIADELHPLAGRIRRIMDQGLPRRRRPSAAAVLTLLVLALAVLPGVRVATGRAPVLARSGGADQPTRALSPIDNDNTAQIEHEDIPQQTEWNGAVAGLVTDHEGQPVEGATVALAHYFDNFSNPLLGKTKADGTYRLERCPRGDSLLTIFKVGLAPETRTLAVGPDNNEFIVSLDVGRSLRLRVTDRSGVPVANANVIPFQWADTVTLTQLHKFGRTDAQGIWSWDWAPDKELPYLITKSGYMDYKYAVLRPADQIHEVQLLPELAVAVKVVDDSTGRPIPEYRATLGLLNPQNAPQAQWLAPLTVKSAEGAETLRQGAIRWEECTVRIEVTGYETETSRRIRADEQNPAVEIRLRTARRRIAVAVDLEGKPVTGAAVFLGTETTTVDVLPIAVNPQGRGWVTRSDGEGRFQFDLPQDPSTVVVMADAGLGVVSSRDIERASAEILSIPLQPWARVEGTVRKGPTPIPNEPIDLALDANVPANGDTAPIVGLVIGPFRSTKSDGQGRFAFDRVPPGLRVRLGHRVTVATPRGPMLGYRHDAFFRPVAGQVRTIVLGGSGRTVIGRFQLKDDSWAVDWKASFGVVDSAVKPGDADVFYRPDPRFPIQEDGAFRLEEVPPGKYKIAFLHLALKPESSLKRQSLSGLLVDTVSVPNSAEGEGDQTVDLGILPVGYITNAR